MKVRKLLCALLAALMVVSVVPAIASAEVDYVEADGAYYNVISKKDYDLAPGIVESEIVLNNDDLTHRQVAHVVEVDLSNPYTKVIPSYKGMIPTAGSYGVQIMSQQAAWAEANGYGNVVAAMNLSLSWYDSAYYVAHPELVGEPLGYMILDGVQYTNSQGQTSGAQTCVVINFDEKDGEARPDDMPKVEIRSTSSAITGWEEQVIPANFGFLVKDGVNQYSVDNNASNGASRSFVGIKADGTFVMVMNDGRQSPYSAGFTSYEMAEFMISLGCVTAVNGDGGGSSAFLSQRPGEELKLNCSPSDGSERPTTHGILVISTAPATGEFVRASLSTEAEYYTPGSTVTFSAIGTDLVGTPADIPADASWQLADESMGTIEDGVFTSNGKVGTATAQLIYNGEVVGEDSIEIVIPEAITFAQAKMTVPFGKEVNIVINATINDGLNDVVLKDSDITLSTTNSALGTFNGLKFTSVSEENAPADLTSTITATLVHNTDLVVTASLNLGKGSEVLFDFEDEADIDGWNIADVNGYDEGFYQNLSYATAENGKVHDGTGSMRVEMNPISATNISCGGYGQSDLFLDEGIVVENAISIGFWAYIPDEYEHCWIRVLYWYDSNDDGVFDKKNTVSVISQPTVYNTFDESGWRYFSVDVSAYSKILIPGLDNTANFGYNSTKNNANNFRFIEFMFPHTNTNDLWKTYGTINGLQTVYIDNITADFSDAVDDREAPIFGSVTISENDTTVALEKYVTATTTNNLLTVTATVAEDTTKSNATGLNTASAKAYVDGVEVASSFANGRLTIADIAVANGIHRVKFEIADNMGNKSVVIRLIEVASDVDASTIKVVPADATLDKLLGGSIYWMNLVATDIETIKSVETVIDLNYGNHFELDHMELAEGFTATYSIDEENNTAKITITRTGASALAGEAVLASLPIRVIYYDTDINVEGYTAETYWTTYEFWPYDVKVDVDMGKITYVDSYNSDVIGAFSNEEFSVDTEIYCPSTQMDATYKAEKGTAHVHTETGVDDVEATCATTGCTGKTYCADCDSIVNWGTVVEATGHSYEVTGNGFYTCDDCGETKCYVDGEYLTGWFTMDSDYYYADANGVVADGEYTVDGHTYTFVGMILTDAAWEHDGAGITAWWAGEQVKGGATFDTKWKVINGKEYYFTDIYAAVGVTQVKFSTNLGYKYYIFGEDGAWMSDYSGFYDGTYDGKSGTYYVENGICVYAGLIYVDGYYYYVNSGCKIVKSQDYGVSKTNDLLPAGTYTFDDQGRMINPPVFEEEKNGIVEEDGKLYYYEDGEKVAKGVVIDEATGNYYCFGIKYYALGEGTYWLNEAKLNGLSNPYGVAMKPGYYTIGADNAIVFTAPKNGIVEENGKLYFYENDVKVKKGLYIDETTGNYYYFGNNYYALGAGEYWFNEAKLNGLSSPYGKVLKAGFYTVADDNTVVFTAPKNGIVEENGKLYFYEDDVKVAKGLVYDEATDTYYCFGIKYYAIGAGEYWFNAAKLNGLTDRSGNELKPGYYTVNDDCTVVIPEPKNGIYEENGKLYYYENNVKVAKGLVYDEATDTYYCFGIKYYAIGAGEYWFNDAKLNGLTDRAGNALKAGMYTVNADCSVVITEPKNGIYEEDGKLYFYENNVKVAKGLYYDEASDNYYCFGIRYYAIGEGEYWFNDAKLNGLTDREGNALKAGMYTVNADCTVVIG